MRAKAAFKIMCNVKPILVVKDMAEAVWGKDVLEKNSITGMVGPRKKCLGELAKEPLTPKVAVVAGESMKKKYLENVELLLSCNILTAATNSASSLIHIH